jgi:glycosyltransferase involved in cell wall biosynthesis
VNFAPYGNTGNILTYILSQYQTIVFFNFNFHHLGKKQSSSSILLYHQGKLIRQKSIFQIYCPPHLVFILLPIRSIIICMQILYHTVSLKKEYGIFDTYFTVNAFTAWVGILLKKLHLVKRTIFWVWDYYPPIHERKSVMFMRSLYWYFDKAATKSDRVIFLNDRLLQLRRKIGILQKMKKYPIVGIGTVVNKAIKRTFHKPLRIAYLGTVKKSQGLDFIFDHEEYIVKNSQPMEIHIFGGGPDEERFKKRASLCPIRCIFHGYIPDSNTLQKSLAQCDIGLALYMPDPGNVSYYGDPSKIKAYISLGMPVITTDVFEFSEEISKTSAGLIIPYEDSTAFTHSIHKIQKNYSYYCQNAIMLARHYEFSKIYPKLFTD